MADTSFELTASIRSALGKGASRRLRREEDLLPAVIYGANKEPQNITLSQRDMLRSLSNPAFYSHVLSIDVAGKKESVVLKDLHRHHSKDRLVHADFMRVKTNAPITMQVPLHIVGDDVAPGLKKGGVLSRLMTELEVTCLPADLPESIDVDITALDIEQSIHLTQVALPQGVRLAHAVEDDAHDQSVVSIHKPRGTEEPAEEETQETDEDAAADSAE